MKHSKAPTGSHTLVEVHVILTNGVSKSFAWTTAIAVMPAYHKAPRWAREELTKLKVRGRTSIEYIDVSVRTRRGTFEKDPSDG